MAIAYDSSAKSTSKTFSHTCTGSNLFLVVVTDSNNANPTAVTYAGVSMTNINSNAFEGYMNIWILCAPATGSNSVVVTTTSTNDAYMSVSYSGVKQTGQPDASNYTSGSMTSGLVDTITTITANDWLIFCGDSSKTYTTTGTNRQLQVFNSTYYSGIDDSNGTVATGSVSMTATSSASIGGFYLFAISPAPAPLVNGSFLPWFL